MVEIRNLATDKRLGRLIYIYLLELGTKLQNVQNIFEKKCYEMDGHRQCTGTLINPISIIERTVSKSIGGSRLDRNRKRSRQRYL